ncbi:ferric iron ABC transporter permease protein [Vibrio astriarenae]|nr:ferric iron ABC transporter permease protein [Vibrio sp. C7]
MGAGFAAGNAGYIVGYIFTDWFDFAGPVQIFLRDITGWGPGEYWFPDIRTLGGAIWVLSLVLYPYVYLLARAAFMEQNVSLLQSARLLKCSPWESFVRISLPLARPSIAVGLSLVAMETIGDFGAVNYFSVSTLRQPFMIHGLAIRACQQPLRSLQ